MSRILRIIQTELDDADRGLNNQSKYPAKTEFNNSFIIHSPRKIGDANTNKKQINSFFNIF